MKVMVTGAKGFISKNLVVRLLEHKKYQILEIDRDSSIEKIEEMLVDVDFIFHLAGVNRPNSDAEYGVGNADFTKFLIDKLLQNKKNIPFVFASSTQAEKNNPYGVSKKKAEEIISTSGLINYFIYRLPNVFGKWSRPNYNSVVATFCYNVSRDLPLLINDKNAPINLVYIDDVVDSFVQLLQKFESKELPTTQCQRVLPVYETTVGELADQIRAFRNVREKLLTESVGTGFIRALYATYVSFLNTDQFSYNVQKYEDTRGIFVEMLKTKESGQFSYFTAHPGVTRGGHYHHTKTEKFLVIRGKARFRFRNVVADEYYELVVDSADLPRIVDTVPGWSHDITNIGQHELIVMLWANEIFDRVKPDTIAYEVST